MVQTLYRVLQAEVKTEVKQEDDQQTDACADVMAKQNDVGAVVTDTDAIGVNTAVHEKLSFSNVAKKLRHLSDDCDRSAAVQSAEDVTVPEFKAGDTPCAALTKETSLLASPTEKTSLSAEPTENTSLSTEPMVDNRMMAPFVALQT